MSQGWYSNEAKVVEDREESLGHKTDKADLLCTEVNVDKRAIGLSRTIRQGLSVYHELNSEGCAYFSSDASGFIYPTCYQDQGPVSVKWVHRVDTRTWEERVYQLDGYRLDLFWGLESWYEWKLNADGAKAYHLCEKELKQGGYEGVLLELDPKSGQTRELERWGRRLGLSADGEQVAMLSGSTNDKNMTLARLLILDVSTGTEKRVLRKFSGTTGDVPYRFVWMKPNLFAVSIKSKVGYRRKKSSFVFIDLKEGEGK